MQPKRFFRCGQDPTQSIIDLIPETLMCPYCYECGVNGYSINVTRSGSLAGSVAKQACGCTVGSLCGCWAYSSQGTAGIGGLAGQVWANATSSYWKPCGHGVGYSCNCPNNGESKVEQIKIDPIQQKCVCDVWRGGCICGHIKPYKPEDIK